MRRTSRVKLRKKTRQALLMRKKDVAVPKKAAKYLATSARFTTMLSNIGVDRIGKYVQSMENHAQVLEEMYKTGIIDNQILEGVVESISKESEDTKKDLCLINNSLIRFLHANSEQLKQLTPPTARQEELQNSLEEEDEETQSLPAPQQDKTPRTAIAAGESRE